MAGNAELPRSAPPAPPRPTLSLPLPHSMRVLFRDRMDGLIDAMYRVPADRSPAPFLHLPVRKRPVGRTHQQSLVTAKPPGRPHSQILNQTQDITTPPLSQIKHTNFDPPLISQQLGKSSQTTIPNAADNQPANDDYDWIKYGHLHVKGSEHSRSLYRCSHSNCLGRKVVERTLDGHVRGTIYKGQHDHPPSQKIDNKAADAFFKTYQALSEEETDEDETGFSSDSESSEVFLASVCEQDSAQPPVMEPRLIVETRSEIELLDDGYKWNAYGLEHIKGSPHTRSYFRCMMQGCRAHKYIERSVADPNLVITTYEGRHNH